MSDRLDFHNGRRRFLGHMVLAATPWLQVLCAEAAETPHLAADDASAKALGYTDDASKISAKAEPAFKAGSHCASCQLFQAAQAKGGYAPCAVFPGKLVSQNGWCRSSMAKA